MRQTSLSSLRQSRLSSPQLKTKTLKEQSLKVYFYLRRVKNLAILRLSAHKIPILCGNIVIETTLFSGCLDDTDFCTKHDKEPCPMTKICLKPSRKSCNIRIFRGFSFIAATLKMHFAASISVRQTAWHLRPVCRSKGDCKIRKIRTSNSIFCLPVYDTMYTRIPLSKINSSIILYKSNRSS